MLLQRKHINISAVLTIAICLLLTHNHQFILIFYQSLTFFISKTHNIIDLQFERCLVKMNTFVVLTAVILLFTVCEGIENYMGTELQKCFNCFCHARTGCYSRFNCASYSISFDYWKVANSPVVDVDDDPDSQTSYRNCMKNENCILATLDQYAKAIGHMDCNCDGVFDCKDRFAIHMYGSECTNPKFSKKYVRRYNSCAKGAGTTAMQTEEGFGGCSPEVF
jgi:hypothetical protein